MKGRKIIQNKKTTVIKISLFSLTIALVSVMIYFLILSIMDLIELSS